MLFLFRLTERNHSDSPSRKGGPHARLSSPEPGRSTLTTSAPMSASSSVAYGPAIDVVRSSTRIPESSEICAPVGGGGKASRGSTKDSGKASKVMETAHRGQTRRNAEEGRFKQRNFGFPPRRCPAPALGVAYGRRTVEPVVLR